MLRPLVPFVPLSLVDLSFLGGQQDLTVVEIDNLLDLTLLSLPLRVW